MGDLGVADKQALIKEFVENDYLFELVAMKHRINRQVYEKLIQVFVTEQVALNKKYVNLNDCFKHFLFWTPSNLPRATVEKKQNKILGEWNMLYVCTKIEQMLQDIIDNFPDEQFLKADGFDDCVIGVEMIVDKPRLVYSVAKVIDSLVNEGMSHEDAIEHYEYNIQGAYMGEQTPVWCYDLFH